MSDVKIGIEETKEVLIALNELSLVIIKILKDGWQPESDIKALIEKITTDMEFQEVLLKAGNNINKVPAEIVDLKAMEGLELFWYQMKTLPRIIDALKGKA